MNKKYDLVVIGAGLSSLMFLSRYLKKFKKHSVLILESKKSIKKDYKLTKKQDKINKRFDKKERKLIKKNNRKSKK